MTTLYYNPDNANKLLIHDRRTGGVAGVGALMTACCCGGTYIDCNSCSPSLLPSYVVTFNGLAEFTGVPLNLLNGAHTFTHTTGCTWAKDFSDLFGEGMLATLYWDTTSGGSWVVQCDLFLGPTWEVAPANAEACDPTAGPYDIADNDYTQEGATCVVSAP